MSDIIDNTVWETLNSRIETREKLDNGATTTIDSNGFSINAPCRMRMYWICGMKQSEVCTNGWSYGVDKFLSDNNIPYRTVFQSYFCRPEFKDKDYPFWVVYDDNKVARKFFKQVKSELLLHEPVLRLHNCPTSSFFFP